jgi:hypothetical protein
MRKITLYTLAGLGLVLALSFVSFGTAASTEREISAEALNGKVHNKLGMPIPDARVRIRGKTTFTTTDNRGEFVLPLDNPKLKWFRFFVSSGKEGYVNSGTRYAPGKKDIAISLQKVPDRDSGNYPLMITSPAGPIPANRGVAQTRDCGNCHTTHLWEWGASKMGKTALNKKVEANYRLFKAEKRADQQDSCADCHLPIAALQAPGKTDLATALHTNANLSKGIDCDFCHKIRDVEVSNRPGVQAIRMNRLSAGNSTTSPLFVYGPYDDALAMPMITSYNPIYTTSEFCSSCHQDAIKLPTGKSWDYLSVYPDSEKYALYEKGTVMPNQWTYQEWLEWQQELPADDKDKGRQCQDCHMNWSKDMVPYYKYIVSGQVRRTMGIERDPESIYPHKFEGATPARLQGSVRLHIASEVVDGKLQVTVEVTNVNAGHRLPTGEHTRNMILLVKAEDEAGEILPLIKGSTIPVWGGKGQAENDYAGRAGKGFARVTGDDKGQINIPVWRATRIVSDNRIKAKATDQSSYQFDLAEVAGSVDQPLYVTARLIYRSDFRSSQAESQLPDEDFVMQEKTVEVGGEL